MYARGDSSRFIAVGSTVDMRALAGKRTRSFDATAMTIVPGFIDTHNHPGGATPLDKVLVGNSFEVEFVTIQSIVDTLTLAPHLGVVRSRL